MFLGMGLILMLFIGCGQSTKDKLIVLQTGRMAGNVYPTELKGLAPLQHYPYLAAYVKQVRAEAEREGAQVLLIDSGDSLMGSFASYATQSQNVVSLFNELKYDAVFLGNLDANLDEAMLAKLKVPVLVPFVRESNEPAMAGTKLGLKLQRGDLELVLLSNFYGNLEKSAAPYRFPVWFGSAAGEVKPLRDYQSVLASLGALSPNPLVIFHWMKFEPTEQAPEAYLEELKKWGVKLILAHSIYSSNQRDTWKQRDFSSWGIPVSENILRQNRGFTVARVDMRRSKSGWKQEGQAKLIPLNANIAQADAEIIKLMSPYAGTIRKADEVLGQLMEDVSEEALLRWHLSNLSRIPGATCVFYSASSVRGGLDSGKLTAGKLYNALPWTNELNLIELTQEQYARLKQMKGYVILSRPGVAQKPVVVSSRYFVRILQSTLGLKQEQVKTVGISNEFDFAKAALKSGASLPSANPQPGDWIYEKLE
jgi:hypothetical protein